MPRYTFECVYCEVRFERNLKMGDWVEHPCPGDCQEMAPRIMEGFAFQFAAGGASPANSGVHDQDYPTADKIVGRDADARWDFMQARDTAKNDLRAKNGKSAMKRVGHKDGSIEYRSMAKPEVDARRKLADATIQHIRTRPQEG